MSMQIEVKLPQIAALSDASLRTALQKGLHTAGGIVAAEMRQQAPGGLNSHLKNSIHAQFESESSIVIAPGVSYAEAIEKGRKPGKLPNMFHGSDFMEWVRLRIVGGRIRSKKRHAEYLDAAWQIGFAIKMRGIKANPFVQRTFEQTQQRANAAVQAAIARFCQ